MRLCSARGACEPSASAVEGPEAQTDLRRVAAQTARLERPSALEHDVVPLPQPTLCMRRFGALRRALGTRVELGQGQMSEDKAELVGEAALEPLDVAVGGAGVGLAPPVCRGRGSLEPCLTMMPLCLCV